MLNTTPAEEISRIIKAPQHAKSFLLALQDNIKKYEAQHGEIKLQGIDSKSRNIGFQQSSEDSGTTKDTKIPPCHRSRAAGQADPHAGRRNFDQLADTKLFLLISSVEKSF